MRGIGWYRRGQSSSDSFLSFLGLWNSIEIVAGKYHIKNEETKDGSKKQIDQVLSTYLPKAQIQFFGRDEQFPWIEENYEMRLNVAHGLGFTNENTFKSCERMIPKIRSIATALLREVLHDRCKSNPKIVELMKQADERE